jgi:hypothetical protein
VYRFNYASPEKKEYIDDELNIGFSLAIFFELATINFQQVTLDMITELWIAVPAKEAVNDPGRHSSGRLHVS